MGQRMYRYTILSNIIKYIYDLYFVDQQQNLGKVIAVRLIENPLSRISEYDSRNNQ